MKNINIMATLFLLIIISACKKDHTTESYYEYGGQKYQITSSQLLAYQTDLTLILKTASAAEYVLIQFNKVNGTLPEGKLTYNGNPATYKAEQHFASVIFGTNGLDNAINGGSITIKKKDNGYQVILDLESAGGKLTGVYNGTPTNKDIKF